MELRDYLAIITQYRTFILSVVVITTALTAALTARQPVRYEGSLTLTVFQDVPVQSATSASYQFDSFYTLQAAGLYAEQLKGRLADPAFVVAVYKAVGAPVPARRLKRLSRLLVAQKQDPTAVQVAIETTDEIQGSAVLAEAGRELTHELTALQASGALTSMRLAVGEPVVLSYHRSVLTTSLIGALASALAALALSFFFEFARPKHE